MATSAKIRSCLAQLITCLVYKWGRELRLRFVGQARKRRLKYYRVPEDWRKGDLKLANVALAEKEDDQRYRLALTYYQPDNKQNLDYCKAWKPTLKPSCRSASKEAKASAKVCDVQAYF